MSNITGPGAFEGAPLPLPPGKKQKKSKVTPPSTPPLGATAPQSISSRRVKRTLPVEEEGVEEVAQRALKKVAVEKEPTVAEMTDSLFTEYQTLSEWMADKSRVTRFLQAIPSAQRAAVIKQAHDLLEGIVPDDRKFNLLCEVLDITGFSSFPSRFVVMKSLEAAKPLLQGMTGREVKDFLYPLLYLSDEERREIFDLLIPLLQNSNNSRQKIGVVSFIAATANDEKANVVDALARALQVVPLFTIHSTLSERTMVLELAKIPVFERDSLLIQAKPLLQSVFLTSRDEIIQTAGKIPPDDREDVFKRATAWLPYAVSDMAKIRVLEVISKIPPNQRDDLVPQLLSVVQSMPSEVAILNALAERPDLLKKEIIEQAKPYLGQSYFPKEIVHAVSLIPLSKVLAGELDGLTFEELQVMPMVLKSLRGDPFVPANLPMLLATRLVERMKREGVESDSPQATIAQQVLNDLAQGQQIKDALSIVEMALEAFPINSRHPLWNMERAIQEATAKQQDPKSGAYFGSFDSSALKGGHLHATHRNIDGDLINSFDFKISHYARDELTSYLSRFLSYAETLAIPEVTIIRRGVPQQFVRFDPDENRFTRTIAFSPMHSEATEIVFLYGAGKVRISETPANGTMYNSIQVEMPANLPPGEGAKNLQMMLAALGLGPILGTQPEETNERMKIAQLLRAYYPPLATKLDTTKEFYRLPISKLKEMIIREEPGMQEVFRKYLEESPELMQKEPTMPGKEVWGVADYAEQLRANGAWGFMQGVGNSAGWESAKVAIARLLTQGAFSSEQRFQTGVFKEGVSSEDDFKSGSADQVFARIVNEFLGKQQIKKFRLSGAAQVLWRLEVAKRIPYCDYLDRYGEKNRLSEKKDEDYDHYLTRKSLIEFARTASDCVNEVMIKNSIDPSFMAGVVVDSRAKKIDLIKYLVEKGLAVRKGGGRVVIKVKEREVPADAFIHVGTQFMKEWF